MSNALELGLLSRTIASHGRVMAAKEMGLEAKLLPTATLSIETSPQANLQAADLCAI
jgi:hypothetical protein